MKPNEQFLLHQNPVFWANVKLISQLVDYAKDGQVKVPVINEIMTKLQERGLSFAHIIDGTNHLTNFGETLLQYFQYRADVLNTMVKSTLMDVEEAKRIFIDLYQNLYYSMQLTCPLIMNKQKGEKKSPSFFTNIINILIEANAEGLKCDYDPRELTSFTFESMPLRTLSRRVDGAFNSTVNPIAIWEIKEYYYTDSFGSRVADGIYETLLDGMEIEELRQHIGRNVKHYLMVDGYKTWWDDGKSYLCRMIDMLHMGYVDEVLFGREVLESLPILVKEWLKEAENRGEMPRAKFESSVAEYDIKSSKPRRKSKKLTKEEEKHFIIKNWIKEKSVLYVTNISLNQIEDADNLNKLEEDGEGNSCQQLELL